MSLDGKQNANGLKAPLKFVSNHTTQKRAEIMHNLGLAFYKLGEYEKSVNCLAEGCELYANKFSVWFWMGVACVKNYLTLSSTYLLKNTNKTILARRPIVAEIDEKLPEKMRLDQAIRYFENVITANENYTRNEFEATKLFREIDFKKMFENIPTVITPSSKENDEKPSEPISQDELIYSMGLFNKGQMERYNEMTKTSYMLLIYCYILLNNWDKALQYCKTLKSDFKLNSRMNFELKMYMAEIYLAKGQSSEAFKCLKVDQAFEEGKDSSGSSENNENYMKVENTVTGVVEEPLPKRAIMFLNIATCNYFLDIPDAASDAIANALECLGYSGDDEKPGARKLKTQEIPEFLLHALIYLNLYNDDQETALKLLRKRRYDKATDNLLDYSKSVGPLKVFK